MDENEKKDRTTAILIAVIVAILIFAAALPFIYDSIEQLSHPGQVKVYDKWMDAEDVAAQRGDSYCKECKKYIEGIVKICPYCGQYIKK